MQRSYTWIIVLSVAGFKKCVELKLQLSKVSTNELNVSDGIIIVFKMKLIHNLGV